MAKSIPVLASLLLSLACGLPGGPPTFDVQTSAAWAHDANTTEEITATMEWAVQYWGGQETDFAGWTFEFVDGQVHGADWGYTDFEAKKVSVTSDGRYYKCVEWTSLAHEVGHVIIGDPDHKDPRWSRMAEPLEEWIATRPECRW